MTDNPDNILTPPEGDEDPDRASIEWFERKPGPAKRGGGYSSPGEDAADDLDLPGDVSTVLNMNIGDLQRLHTEAIEKAKASYNADDEVERLREITEGLFSYLSDYFKGKRARTRKAAEAALRFWVAMKGDHYEGHDFNISEADACWKQRVRLSGKAAMASGIIDKDRVKAFYRWADAEFGDPEERD